MKQLNRQKNTQTIRLRYQNLNTYKGNGRLSRAKEEDIFGNKSDGYYSQEYYFTGIDIFSFQSTLI